jgi:hypothetical protein
MPAVVRHVCAATYATSAANTDACPAGYSKITVATTCKAAAAFLGTPYNDFSVVSLERPSGCSLSTVNNPTVYLNNDATGAAAATAQPLCLLFGVPPQPPSAAHLRGTP